MSAAIWKDIPGTLAKMSDDGIVVDEHGNEVDAPEGVLHLRDVDDNVVQRDLEATYNRLFPNDEDDALEALGVRRVPSMPRHAVSRRGIVLNVDMHKWMHPNERGLVRLGSRVVPASDLVAEAWGDSR